MGFVACMGEERLPQRVTLGELNGGKGYSGGQEKDWMVHLKVDILVFGMKFEGWRNIALKAGSWFRRVEATESFMWKWHDTKRCRAAEQHAKAASAPSTSASLSGRGEGGGGGGRGEGEKRGGGRREGGRGGPAHLEAEV